MVRGQIERLIGETMMCRQPASVSENLLSDDATKLVNEVQQLNLFQRIPAPAARLRPT
jgi:hypothetical protein